MIVGPLSQSSPGSPSFASEFSASSRTKRASRFGRRTPTDPTLPNETSGGRRWDVGDVSVRPYPGFVSVMSISCSELREE